MSLYQNGPKGNYEHIIRIWFLLLPENGSEVIQMHAKTYNYLEKGPQRPFLMNEDSKHGAQLEMD